MTADAIERLLSVTVVPGARSAGVVGPFDGGVKIRLRSPADRGRANDELCKLIADSLGTPRSAVRIETGHTSRRKRISVDGFTPSQVTERLIEHGS